MAGLVLSKGFVGATVGSTVSGAVLLGFIWRRLSFVPDTEQTAYPPAVLATLAGLIINEVVQDSKRLQAYRLYYAGGCAIAFIVLLVSYNRYVLWATKHAALTGWAELGQDLMLFVTVLLWSFCCAVAGRSAQELLS